MCNEVSPADLWDLCRSLATNEAQEWYTIDCGKDECGVGAKINFPRRISLQGKRSILGHLVTDLMAMAYDE